MIERTGKSNIERIRDRIDHELAKNSQKQIGERGFILLECRNLLLDYQIKNGGI